MKKKKQLVLMIGIPGSGKSTVVNKYMIKNYQVLCLDDIRLALGSAYDPKTEPVVYAITDVQARAWMIRGLSIVVDATCCQIYIVEKWKKLADEYGYDLVGVKLNTPFNKCQERREGQITPVKMRSMDNDLTDLLEVYDVYFKKFINVYNKKK